MMKKKKQVPEWMNSSLWSSPSDHHRFSPPSPPPPPPPVSVREDPPTNHNASPSSSSVDSSASASSAADDISSQTQLLTELSRKMIDMRELRRVASQGIPRAAAPALRPTLWKLLLGYLPSDRALWSSELTKKRSQYRHFKDDLLMNPSEITRRIYNSAAHDIDDAKSETRILLSRSQITHEDHPLSLGKTSIWNQFFQDTELIEQIDRDVKRTHPDIHFFSGDSQLAKSNQDALKSILIIFAKLNPGIRYVQGMNEVLAPLFYVFKNDPDEENAAFAEADTFFCFVELLSGFQDNFCQQLDNSIVGIRSTITRLSQLLKEHDEELWRHLEVTTEVNPQFYAFRWITLLLTQEFNFSDILHIWDVILSDPEGPQFIGSFLKGKMIRTRSKLLRCVSLERTRVCYSLQETLLRICCAMLILVRRRLLAGDFTSNLKLLQSYPSTNISHLLHVANKLRVQSG
ncbi:TBC1 domain family member 13-like isoform X1 [Vigna unguiculata]|uniref:TBC1 domain family member 13-like isoform X1 n=1 Tax=Vigna unguiculata TaxID=3917 RepID=UPI00101608FC|nr:TBC1 domain family member 13-like isoform X1 [Vigna unguiculata]